MTIQPMTLRLSDAVLDDLHDRLDRTRYVPSIGSGSAGSGSAGSGSSAARPAGLGGDRLRELVEGWRAFDWRAEEERLGAYEHGLAEVRGHRIHFVRVRPVQPLPPGTRVVPLLLLHGWPSAFTEYLPLADLLAGSTEGDVAFDVVVPSLPGFVFSELPKGPLTRSAIAEDLHALMTDALGFDRYAAFGGDIGGGAATWLGVDHADAIIGVQLIHPPFPADETPQDEAEKAYLDALAEYDADDGGYSAIMETRPDTIAAALADSPAGLLAWIADKWDAWTDGGLAALDPAILYRVATLYWATGSIGTSFQQYFDWPANPPRPPITAPLGVLLSRETGFRAYPRSLAERAATDLRTFEPAAAGGHFLGAEQPEATAAAIRRFFGDVLGE